MNVIVLAALAALAWAQDPAPTELEQAQGQANQAASRAGRSVSRRQDLERLRKDLRYIAEELDRELLGPRTNARDTATALNARIAGLRARGNIDPRLDPVLVRLERLFATMEQREHIDFFVWSFVRAVTDELREAADTAKDQASLLKTLDERLDVPIDAEAFLKEDLTLAQFRKQGPIKIFIAKHRLKRPKRHVTTTAPAVVASRHHVQIGVELEGVVTRRNPSIDGDTTFDIGHLHIEVTPEWRLVYGRDMPIPHVGDRVRLKGWTYYDSFHKSEEEYDAADPDLGAERKTLWEVHPVLDVEILPPAQKK